MMRFAVGGKCGKPESPPVAGCSPALRRPVNAAMPAPVEARPKKWRRVMRRAFSRSAVSSRRYIALFLRYRFIQIEHQAGGGGIRSQIGFVQTRRFGRLAIAE